MFNDFKYLHAGTAPAYSIGMKGTYNMNEQMNEQRVADMVCNAFEGGIGYWAKITGYRKPENVFKWDLSFDDGKVCRYVQYPMSQNGAVLLCDAEDSSEKWELTREKLENGLTVMADKYPRHYKNWIDENDDAETADVFIQCSLFGELVYG